MSAPPVRGLLYAPVVAVAVLLAVALSPLILCVLFARWLYGRWLRRRFRKRWEAAGRFIVFVYSDSPNWQSYLEEKILPRVQPHAVVLNWSERNRWEKPWSVEVKAFRHWAGRLEFNPIAILLAPGRPVEIIRFWQPFRDFKHGKTAALRTAERLLFSWLPEANSATPGQANQERAGRG